MSGNIPEVVTIPRRRGRPFGSKNKPKEYQQEKPLSPVEQAQVAAMTATGMSPLAIKKALETSYKRVKAILTLPSTQSMILDFRQITKVQALQGIQQAQADVWKNVGRAAKGGDAGQFRDWTAGALNLEKIAYSTSGEAKPPQIHQNLAIFHQGNVSEEAKALVQALAPHLNGESR